MDKSLELKLSGHITLPLPPKKISLICLPESLHVLGRDPKTLKFFSTKYATTLLLCAFAYNVFSKKI